MRTESGARIKGALEAANAVTSSLAVSVFETAAAFCITAFAASAALEVAAADTLAICCSTAGLGGEVRIRVRDCTCVGTLHDER